jgi:hypothetical protein
MIFIEVVDELLGDDTYTSNLFYFEILVFHKYLTILIYL